MPHTQLRERSTIKRATQTAATAVVAPDLDPELMEKYCVPVSITWTWTVTAEFDTSKLPAGNSYEVEIPLMLNGCNHDGWVNPLTLDLEPTEGSKPPPNTIYPDSIPLGRYQYFSFPSFTAHGSGSIRLTASTMHKDNLRSALLVQNEQARIKGTTINIPLSIRWTGRVTGRVQGKDYREGCEYEIRLPLMLNGETYEGWSKPLTLQTRQPGQSQNQLPACTVHPQSMPLDSYQDFAFPKFVAQGGPESTVLFTAATTQTANLPSSLVVANGRAKIRQVSFPVSVTFAWTASGEFDTSKLTAGRSYGVDLLSVTLDGSGRDGWINPLTLDIDQPSDQGEKKAPANAVSMGSVSLSGYSNFSFPSFTARGSGNIRLTASTTQNANLSSALRINTAKISSPDYTIPLFVSSTWAFTGQIDVDALDRGSAYEIELPLKLNRQAHDGWSSPMILQLQLPPGQEQLPPKIVYPQSLPSDSYQDLAFPRFVAGGAFGTIDITATTTQTASPPSALLVAAEQAKIREVV